jgi:pimeloyl-ACP methyl ester carboxylesterase
MNLSRYDNSLLLKETDISSNLTMQYLENDVKSNTTLVLLHGFASNKDHWLQLASAFDGKYHLIIPDLIGSGDSSKPLDIDYSISKQTQRLEKFLSKFKVKNLVLVGSSMGGQIALSHASRYKSSNALILIDPMGLKVAPSFIDNLGIKKQKEIYLDVCTVEKMNTVIDLTWGKRPYVPYNILEYLTDKKCKLSKIEEQQLYFLFDKDLNLLDNAMQKAKGLSVPTLILWGKEDKIISVKNAYAFNQHIKNSKLIIFEGLGHMPMMENASLTAKNIMKFLENNKKR